MRPSDLDVVAVVTGTGEQRRWYFKLSYGDTHAEATALTFNEAVNKVRTFAERLDVGGFVETVAGRTWYPVVAAGAQAPSAVPEAAPLPIWITSKRARRKAARKAVKTAARLTNAHIE